MRLTMLSLICLGLSCQPAARAEPEASLQQAEASGEHAGGTRGSALVTGVPHVLQRPDFCGEACAEMVLRHLGYDLDQDSVFERSGLDPALGRGCYTRDLKRALEAIGFLVGPVWHSVQPAHAEQELSALFDTLHGDLLRGVPSIVCTRYDGSPDAAEHFRLVVGYDAESDEVVYHDPALLDGAHLRMRRQRFLELWPLEYRRDCWTVIRFRMEPGRIVTTSRPRGPSRADFAQHVAELRRRLPQGFQVVVEAPFVVIGDEPAAVVRRRASRTVKWAVDRLKEAYFQHDPQEVLEIWLFKDDKSYREHTESLFGEDPHTPFGYYSESHGALVMNIATGGGTLVHEIVHPFMRANFPGCPAWLNEGLGSLYEQCGEDEEGRIMGKTNWRLAGLQEAIRQGRLPTFRRLTATTDSQFYNDDPGTNYAQARYLCYYLQERGRLRRFYHQFLKARETDPTGYRTLRRVLGIGDEDQFQQQWEASILGLTYP